MRIWALGYNRQQEHAAELAAGLCVLTSVAARAPFTARLCFMCEGQGGERKYTGGGSYYISSFACRTCDGTGLLSGDDPAPESVVNQVVNACRSEAEKPVARSELETKGDLK